VPQQCALSRMIGQTLIVRLHLFLRTSYEVARSLLQLVEDRGMKRGQHLRLLLKHYLPIIPGTLILVLRLFVAYLASHGKNAAIKCDAVFFTGACLWATLSLLTSVTLRLFVDNRLLALGDVSPDRIDPQLYDSIYRFEATIFVFMIVVFLVSTAVETASPGALLFAAWPLASLCVVVPVYLTIALIGRRIKGLA
jgi:hypothetical protein